MKCLEKDRRRRYETPSELAADLKRHLSDEPVSAAAPTLAYTLRKLHRKHRALVRSAMIVSAVLVIASAISTASAIRMNQLRKDAELARQAESDQRAKAESERNRAIAAEHEVQARSMELENNLYVSDMLAVEDAEAKEEFLRAEQLLLQHRKEPSGRDLRGFEWRFYWQRTRGEQLASFQAHDSAVNRTSINHSEIKQIRFLDGGRQLMTGGNDGKIKLWNLSTHHLVQEWDSRSRFVISANEQFLCFMEPERGLTMWNLQARRLVRSGYGIDGYFARFAFTHDNRFLIVNAADREYQFKTFTVLEVLSGKDTFAPKGYWPDFAVSPTDSVLLTIGTDDQRPGRPSDSKTPTELPRGYLWNHQSRELVYPPMPAHGMGVRFSPSGHFIAINNSSHPPDPNAIVDINIYRLATGEFISTLHEADLGSGNPVELESTVAFSSDEKCIAAPTSSFSRRIGVWDIATGERISSRENQLPDAPPVDSSPLFSSRSTYLILGERTASSAPLTRVMPVGPGAPPPNIRRSVFATTNNQRLWDVPRGEKALGFSTDENILLSVTTNQIFHRAAPTGSLVHTVTIESPLQGIDFNRPALHRLDLSTDGARISTIDEDRTIRVISTSTGGTMATYDSPWGDSPAQGVSTAFSPSGKKLVFNSMKPTGCGILDLDQNAITWLVPLNHAWTYNKLVISSDEEFVAGNCSDNTVRIWSMATGEQIQSIEGADAADLQFTPDSRTLILTRNVRATTSKRLITTLKLFNTRTWRQIAELPSPPASEFKSRDVLSPDGQYLMTYNTEGGIILIRTPFIEEIEELITNHPDP